MISLLQRTRYFNAVNTLKELLNMGVVPIVNENDTVSVSVSVPSRTVEVPFLYLTSFVENRKSNLAITIRYLRSRRR